MGGDNHSLEVTYATIFNLLSDYFFVKNTNHNELTSLGVIYKIGVFVDKKSGFIPTPLSRHQKRKCEGITKNAVKSTFSGVLFHILTVLSTFYHFFLLNRFAVVDITIYLFKYNFLTNKNQNYEQSRID